MEVSVLLPHFLESAQPVVRGNFPSFPTVLSCLFSCSFSLECVGWSGLCKEEELKTSFLPPAHVQTRF